MSTLRINGSVPKKAQRFAAEYEDAASEIRRIHQDLEGTIGDGLD
jgi:hypothetical protein